MRARAFGMKFVIALLTIIIATFLTTSFAAKIIYITTPWGVPSKDLLAEFEKQTGITVEVTTIGDEQSLRDKVMTATLGGVKVADVIFTGITNLGVFASSGSIDKLNNMVDSDFLSKLVGVKQFTIDGDIYGVPIYQQMVMIDYDDSVLKQMGASVPKTWDEFYELCKEIKQKGIRDYPVTFGARAWSWYLIALSMGDPLFDEELNPTFDKPDSGGLRAMVLLQKMFKEGLISPERITSVNPHPAFWAGAAVFHQAWQGSLAIANDPEKSKIAPNARYMLLPDEHYTWSLPAALSIARLSDMKKEALEFIKWFTTEKVQSYLYDAYGMFPANKEVFDKLGEQGKIEGYEVMAEQMKYVRYLPYHVPWYTEFETEANEIIKKVAREEMTPEAAVKHLADFWRELKEEYE
ncbi:MAG: multiple sugar transport system substrate-binding protein [Thermotogaceae bacterium]|jgi:multiple sugar transport system substrate-binding protein|nr:multiple sugar transport system substrate-binding protein [Thermotogaceae bacterium]